ncbi:Uncharacterised protein [Mycobacteroides abscessus subsp. abscessus]|nr:Uncharacterised protein [Mycobacteroides abscessus subsp. abscessus]
MLASWISSRDESISRESSWPDPLNALNASASTSRSRVSATVFTRPSA